MPTVDVVDEPWDRAMQERDSQGAASHPVRLEQSEERDGTRGWRGSRQGSDHGDFADSIHRSVSLDSTNRGSVAFEKDSRQFQKANLNLPRSSNCFHSIYIVVGIISNLEML